MQTFLAVLIFMVISIIGMALGVIFSTKPLKGSCGGLNRLMGDDCEFCSEEERCPKKENSLIYI